MKTQKKRIEELETNVSDAKAMYNDALKNLEKISEEIHKMREERQLCDNENRMHCNNDLRDETTGDNDDVINGSPYMLSHSSEINSFDEYLSFPPKLSTKSSPVRQQKIDNLDCPHLLKDFVPYGGQQQQHHHHQKASLMGFSYGEGAAAARQSSSTDDCSDPNNATDIVSTALKFLLFFCFCLIKLFAHYRQTFHLTLNNGPRYVYQIRKVQVLVIHNIQWLMIVHQPNRHRHRQPVPVKLHVRQFLQPIILAVKNQIEMVKMMKHCLHGFQNRAV